MAFNEADSLDVVVREIEFALTQLGKTYECEIVVIDDGSTDETGQIADQLASMCGKVRVVHHETNQGLGGVYRTGFAHVRGDFVTFFPADGQFPAIIIKQFISLIGAAELVLGYLPNRDSSVFSKCLSKGERTLYSLLFGPLPRFQGVFMFRRTILDGLTLMSTGRSWAVLMELVIRSHRNGYRIVSVPTEMRPRMSGRSKVANLRTILDNLKQAFALRRHI